jgi:hypothetical protein
MKPLDGRGERHPKTRSLSYSEPSDAVEIPQLVEKLLRALFRPRFSGRIWRYRSVLALFSGSRGEPIGLTTPFSTG